MKINALISKPTSVTKGVCISNGGVVSMGRVCHQQGYPVLYIKLKVGETKVWNVLQTNKLVLQKFLLPSTAPITLHFTPHWADLQYIAHCNDQIMKRLYTAVTMTMTSITWFRHNNLEVWGEIEGSAEKVLAQLQYFHTSSGILVRCEWIHKQSGKFAAISFLEKFSEKI